MKEKYRKWKEKHPKQADVLKFVARTLLYFLIIFTLFYLYQYKNISGGTFIYNEF